LLRVLSKNDIQYWADRFIDELQQPPAPASRLEQIASAGITP
jgi:hypothetical protein